MVELVAEPGSEESTWLREPGEMLVPGYLAWTRLGGGEHCETWLAWSTAHWCPVAVKLPRPDEVRDPDTRSDLALEARRLARVSHPGVQRLMAEHVDDPVPHLVLEYVEGPTLSSVLQPGPLTAVDAVLVGLQVQSALAHLHGLRLVHLDVKPGNIVIREGRPVLLDLGITTGEGTAYPAGECPGTPGYMAEELFQGGEITAAADTFALGTTLVRCLRDSPDRDSPDRDSPDRDTGSAPATFIPPQLPTDLDPGLAAVLGSMLARDATSRPDDRTVLRRLAEQLPDGHPGLWPAWADQALRPVPAV
jgi:serine/threonine protein kinase